METGFAIENEIVEITPSCTSPPTDQTEGRKKDAPSSSDLGWAFID